MAIPLAMQQRLIKEIDALDERIRQLQIDEENFADWFDAQLFNQEASSPTDYVQELRDNLAALNRTTQSSRSQWLAQRIADQLGALHQATRWFEKA